MAEHPGYNPCAEHCEGILGLEIASYGAFLSPAWARAQGQVSEALHLYRHYIF